MTRNEKLTSSSDLLKKTIITKEIYQTKPFLKILEEHI